MSIERAFIDEEHSYLAFPARLRKLAPKAEDVKKLSEYLDCSVQAVNQYKTGVSFPKVENLIRIAHYFHCSLDYLIGLSDARNPDDILQTIHKATGLSESAIFKLNDIARGKDKSTFPRIISALIEDNNAEFFLAILDSLIQIDAAPDPDAQKVTIEIGGKTLSLNSSHHLKAVFQSLITESIPDIIRLYKEQEVL